MVDFIREDSQQNVVDISVQNLKDFAIITPEEGQQYNYLEEDIVMILPELKGNFEYYFMDVKVLNDDNIYPMFKATQEDGHIFKYTKGELLGPIDGDFLVNTLKKDEIHVSILTNYQNSINLESKFSKTVLEINKRYLRNIVLNIER